MSAIDREKLLELIKSRKTKLAGSYKDIEYGAYLELDAIEAHLEYGLFDAPSDYLTSDAYEAACKALWKHRDEAQRLRAALESLPDKIMQISRFADTEELTFPLENPTAEEQSEWLDEFLDRLDMHVRNIVDNEIEAISPTTEPTGAERVRETWSHHCPNVVDNYGPQVVEWGKSCPFCGINEPEKEGRK